jgi:hypothetical protein
VKMTQKSAKKLLQMRLKYVLKKSIGILNRIVTRTQCNIAVTKVTEKKVQTKTEKYFTPIE